MRYMGIRLIKNICCEAVPTSFRSAAILRHTETIDPVFRRYSSRYYILLPENDVRNSVMINTGKAPAIIAGMAKPVSLADAEWTIACRCSFREPSLTFVG